MRNVAFFVTRLLHILFVIKLNLLKTEKSLKSVFWTDKKLHDANRWLKDFRDGEVTIDLGREFQVCTTIFTKKLSLIG